MIGRVFILALALIGAGAHGQSTPLFDASKPLSLASAKGMSPALAMRLDRMPSDPNSMGAQVFPLNAAALESTAITFTMGGITRTYVGAKECNDAKLGAGVCVWEGKSGAGLGGGSMSLAWQKADPRGTVAGRVAGPGHTFNISPLMGRYLVIEERGNGGRSIREPAMPTGTGPQKAAAGGTKRALSTTPSGGPVVGITVVCSTLADQYLQRSCAVNAALEVTSINTAFSNSNIDAAVIVRGTMESSSSYLVNGNLCNILTALQTDAAVTSLRNVSEGDVVMAITDAPTDPAFPYDGCAMQVYATNLSAFAVVQANSLDSLTFAHEFGHLAGGRHQFGGGQSPDSNQFPFKYGHGWINHDFPPAGTGFPTNQRLCFHTIMANKYGDVTGCNPNIGLDDRQPFFSNPLVTVFAVPSGNALVADMASALRLNLPGMAGFHALNNLGGGGGGGGPGPTTVVKAGVAGAAAIAAPPSPAYISTLLAD